MVVRNGLKGWSSWIVYIIVGIMQIMLIILGVLFSLRDRKQKMAPIDIGKPPSLLEHFKIPGWNASAQSVASSQLSPEERRPLLGGPAGSAESNQRAMSNSRARVEECGF